MAVLALGISFRRAPIDLLERLAFAEDDLVKVYRRVQDGDHVEEAVVLSTCNRVEMYGVVPSYHAGFLTLKRLLAETRGVAEADIADGLYAHWERDAVEHLFSVAGGLDSMVLGETQIQSQRDNPTKNREERMNKTAYESIIICLIIQLDSFAILAS